MAERFPRTQTQCVCGTGSLPFKNLVSVALWKVPRASSWESWILFWLCQQLAMGPKISEVQSSKPLVPKSHCTSRGNAPHPSSCYFHGSSVGRGRRIHMKPPKEHYFPVESWAGRFSLMVWLPECQQIQSGEPSAYLNVHVGN